MATRTTNLSLIKPDYEDAADIAVINANMDTLDTEVNNLKKDNGLIDTKIAAHNVAADAHANRFANYLPLAGGTMTGEIGFDGTTKTLSVTGDDVTWGGKEIKSMAFPSSTSVNIPLGASGSTTTYTAPANGWICLTAKNANGCLARVVHSGVSSATTTGNASYSAAIMYPAVKGGNYELIYVSSSASASSAKFFYAEGEV